MTPEEQKEKIRNLAQTEVTVMMLVINLTVPVTLLAAYIIEKVTNLSYFHAGIRALIIVSIILFCFRSKINNALPLYIENKFLAKTSRLTRTLILWGVIFAPLLIMNLWKYIRTCASM